jgi:hypothetical protein
MNRKIEKTLLVTAFIFMPLILFAQNTETTDTLSTEKDSSLYHTEYLDGKKAFIYSDSIIGLAVTNTLIKDDYGKFYQLGISIANNSKKAFNFDPSLIKADIQYSKESKEPLRVYTAEGFMKMIKHKQSVSEVLTAFALGVSSASASYSNSTSYTTASNGNMYMTTTRTYNPTAAYLAQMQTSNTLENMDTKYENDRRIKEMGYLKLNTLHPGNIISGFVNIKREKGTNLIVYIEAEGRAFKFVFPVEKLK